MGRKNRNKLSKEKEKEKDNDIQEDEELCILQQQENVEENKTRQIMIKEDLICDIRDKMLKYCDNTGIPLCDYLTLDIFDQFIEYLTENN